MSLQTTYNQYLETDYLTESYGGGAAKGAMYGQFQAVINTTNVINSQFNGIINKTLALNSQFSGTINQQLALKGQFSAEILDFKERLLGQYDAQIDIENVLKSEANLIIDTFKKTLSQFNGDISNQEAVKAQFDANILGTGAVLKTEALATNMFVRLCSFYLEGGYLEDDYLVPQICASLRSQILANVLDVKSEVLSQIHGQIVDSPVQIFSQFEGKINTEVKLKAQFESQIVGSINAQFTSIIYNTTNLRILCDFASRGTTGTNWTAKVGATDASETGDFDINNVNTDIVEQRFQSKSGFITSLNLVCDTEITQGVTIDTLAILDHNITTSGSLVLQGSSDSGFSSIDTNIELTITENNIYYISEDFPTFVDQNRYWRLVINDSNNADNYIRIGCILFGNSIIMQGDCIEDRIRKKTRDYVDEVETEGFTNVSNERTKKRSVNFRFPKIQYGNGNYVKLNDLFESAGTTLKCLWIPDPQYASRFAVFGKLTQIPDEEHEVMGDKNQDLDFITMTIDVDEGR